MRKFAKVMNNVGHPKHSFTIGEIVEEVGAPTPTGTAFFVSKDGKKTELMAMCQFKYVEDEISYLARDYRRAEEKRRKALRDAAQALAEMYEAHADAIAYEGVTTESFFEEVAIQNGEEMAK